MKIGKPPAHLQKAKETRIQRKDIQPLLKEQQVEIYHSQSYKLAINYQSSEANYGVKLTCDDNPKAIKEAIQRAQDIIEPPLHKKIMKQRQFLDGLSS